VTGDDDQADERVQARERWHGVADELVMEGADLGVPLLAVGFTSSGTARLEELKPDGTLAYLGTVRVDG
jgi:hypothetical protein